MDIRECNDKGIWVLDYSSTTDDDGGDGDGGSGGRERYAIMR